MGAPGTPQPSPVADPRPARLSALCVNVYTGLVARPCAGQHQAAGWGNVNEGQGPPGSRELL